MQCFVIFNVIDNNNSYALSKHKSRKSEQNASHLAKDSELKVQNLNEICHKNCSPSTTITLAVSKFSTIFRGACPRVALQPFLSLDSHQSNSVGKTTLKKSQNLATSSLTKSNYDPDVKHSQRAYLHSFPGPNV